MGVGFFEMVERKEYEEHSGKVLDHVLQSLSISPIGLNNLRH